MLQARSHSVVELKKQLSVFLFLFDSWSIKWAVFCPPVKFPYFLPSPPAHIANLCQQSWSYSSTSFRFLLPLFIPHSTRLPDGVLFCLCDPLMPSNRAGNILKGFGQGWFGSLKYCLGICIIQRSWLRANHRSLLIKTGIKVRSAKQGFELRTLRMGLPWSGNPKHCFCF